MLRVDLSPISDFIISIFEEVIDFCADVLWYFKIGNFTLLQFFITIILLSFLIPLIINLPNNIRNKGERRK